MDLGPGCTKLWTDGHTALASETERRVSPEMTTLKHWESVLEEAVAIRAIAARKVDTLRNLADVFTKYIKFDRWRCFMDELLNIAHRAAPLPLDHVFASA